MPVQDLSSWLARLERLHPTEIELGLERVGSVARRLQCLQFSAPVVTVAGTNGKGSTVAVLELLAIRAGWKVGCSTSPHLLRFNERIRISGEPVGDAELVASFEQIEAVRGNVSLTYFEFTTLAALLIFQQRQLDLVILEVGLGGRLDAANIIDAGIAIITSISLDHQAWLGDTRELIGAEKAGILRRGCKVVVADPDPPLSVLERIRALECDSHLYDPVLASAFPDFPLRRENIAAAWTAAQLLGMELPALDEPAQWLADVQLQGRLQKFEWQGRIVYLDVAHNPASVENMLAQLCALDPEHLFCLFGVLSDKDIHAMIRSCRGRFNGWYVTDLPATSRAMPAATLAQLLGTQGEVVMAQCESPAQAWPVAIHELEEGDTLVVFGSFYTVAGVLPLLQA